METDGTSMKLSKYMRSKIQTTRLNSEAGGATFPCIVISSGDGKTIAQQFMETLTAAAKTYCWMQQALHIKTYEKNTALADNAREIAEVLVGRQFSLLSDGGGEN